jgi:uncharacterized membrane protein YfcA
VSAGEYILLAAGALVASTVSGIAGVGGGMIYLPLLTHIVGIRLAVPYLSILLLAGNLSRAYFARKSIDWAALKHFFYGAIPGALIGALFFTVLSAFWIEKILGVYLLSYVALSFTKASWPKTATLRSIAWMGLPSGFASGMVGGAGLIMAPYLLRYGLIKEAFLGTEALAAAGTHIVKLAVWGPANIIGWHDVLILLPLAVLMVVGTYFGKLLINRMRAQVFRGILLFMLFLVGVRFLFF